MNLREFVQVMFQAQLPTINLNAGQVHVRGRQKSCCMVHVFEDRQDFSLVFNDSQTDANELMTSIWIRCCDGSTFHVLVRDADQSGWLS